MRVPPGEPIDLSSTFAGLPVLESNHVPLSSLQGTVTVFLIMAGPDVRAEMAFENIDPETLNDGKFVYHSGDVRDRPCDTAAE